MFILAEVFIFLGEGKANKWGDYHQHDLGKKVRRQVVPLWLMHSC